MMMATGLILSFVFMFGRRKGKRIRLTKLGMSVVFVLYVGFAWAFVLGPSGKQQKVPKGPPNPPRFINNTGRAGPYCPEMQRKLDVDDFAASEHWKSRKAELEMNGVKNADSIIDTYRETGSFLPRTWSQDEEFQGRLWGEELFEKVGVCLNTAVSAHLSFTLKHFAWGRESEFRAFSRVY